MAMTMNWCLEHKAAVHIPPGTTELRCDVWVIAQLDHAVLDKPCRIVESTQLTLTDNGIGVEDRDQAVVGCCYDEGPYWNVPAGRYMLIPLDPETPGWFIDGEGHPSVGDVNIKGSLVNSEAPVDDG